jgi:hypothetical protein
MFLQLRLVVEAGITIPCSNAWPERGASVLKLTKTKFRNRINHQMLKGLHHDFHQKIKKDYSQKY